jgi:hypothetical protein
VDLSAFKAFNQAVLDVIDDLEIHREAGSIPLEFRGAGEILRPAPDKLVIVGPEGDPADFLASLYDRLEAMDLSELPKL